MPEALISPSVAVVLLGLLASVGWGIADFGGGLSSKSAPVVGVLFASQAASLLVAVPLFAVAREPAMATNDLALSVVGGLLGATGLGLLYRGLSVGRMGVVAPIAAVLTATLPVGFGFITESVPSIPAIVGIAVAVVSVVLVSRNPGMDDSRPTGLRYGVSAGIIFGLFPIVASRFNEDLIVSPVVLIRFVSILAVGTFILVRRADWRVPRRLWPAMLLVGVIDMLATTTYLTSIAIGPLAIAAIMASLYPVVTTILASVVLREHASRVQVAGIVAAALAVVLIAGAPAA